ncbi:MAG: hypothetical protein ACRDOH_26635 [Streptosporangiaceae bacterium]
MTQGRFAVVKFCLLPRGPGAGSLAQFRCGEQRVLHPSGAVGVALLHHLDQGTGRLGEPVLQVAAGPADLTFHQAGSLSAQVLPGRPPAQLAWEPAADRARQQLGLARLGGGVEEPPVLGQPSARLRHGEVKAEQLGSRPAQHLQLGLQADRQPGVDGGHRRIAQGLAACVPVGRYTRMGLPRVTCGDEAAARRGEAFPSPGFAVAGRAGVAPRHLTSVLSGNSRCGHLGLLALARSGVMR